MKIQWLRNVEDLMVAVTFAERNEHDTAIRLMKGERNAAKSFQAKRKTAHQSQRPQMRL